MTTQKNQVSDAELSGIAHMTAQMRSLEQQIKVISTKRRSALLRLSRGDEQTERVSYARLAEACGLSEVAIYKALRGSGAPLRRPPRQK